MVVRKSTDFAISLKRLKSQHSRLPLANVYFVSHFSVSFYKGV